MKKVVPLHDDLFDFIYEAMPGYEEVGRRRVLLNCWGSFQDPDVCNFNYRDMTEWGRAMFRFCGLGMVVWFHGCRMSMGFPSGSCFTN